MGRSIARKKRRIIESKKEPDHLFLPQELINEILLRLSVESLLRFKSVCKDWYSLITNSDFVNNHLDHPSNHSSLLVYHDAPGSSSAFSTFQDESLAGGTPTSRKLRHMYMDKKEGVIGPVSGLFCIYHYYDNWNRYIYCAIIMNPATRECKPIIVPEFDDLNYSKSFHMFGFGMDTLTSGYKVVSTWCWDESVYYQLPANDLRTSVYSLANDSWTYHDIDPSINQPRSKIYDSGSIYINGSCYWLLRDKSNNVYLHSFDFSNEMMREIKGPEYDNTNLIWNSRLVLHNDTPSIFIYQPFKGNYIDVMVMKEDGYWTKDLSVDISHLQISCVPLGSWKNNNLLLQKVCWGKRNRQLVLFDPNTYRVKELGFNYAYSSFVYKESLISLKGVNSDSLIQQSKREMTTVQKRSKTRYFTRNNTSTVRTLYSLKRYTLLD